MLFRVHHFRSLINLVSPLADDNNSGNNLSFLDLKTTLSERIDKLYQYVVSRFNFVDHISVVVYDPETAVLKSFLATGNGPSPLTNYEAQLVNVPSLQKILQDGKPRIINDLLQFSSSTNVHTQRLIKAGYRSSYTIPMYMEDEFYGFVFYNSLTSSAFTGDVITHLDPIARLLALVVIHDIRSIRTLTAATQTAQHITSRRDYETGAHLQRMSRYSRLVAGLLSKEHGLTDEILEHIFLFAPLHDVGKIAIPDKILLKPGRLTKKEYRIMKTHVEKGLEIINYMLAAFHLTEMSHINILTNIVLYHHESYDGSGYPRGLVGKHIPIEARIIAIADVFDALSSPRPYKKAWSNERSFAEIERIANFKLDPECANVLLGARHEVEQIQAQFQENIYD